MYVCIRHLLVCLLLCCHRLGTGLDAGHIICACWMPCHAMLCPWVADANRHARQCHASMPCVLMRIHVMCLRASISSGVRIGHPSACHASLWCSLQIVEKNKSVLIVRTSYVYVASVGGSLLRLHSHTARHYACTLRIVAACKTRQAQLTRSQSLHHCRAKPVANTSGACSNAKLVTRCRV